MMYWRLIRGNLLGYLLMATKLFQTTTAQVLMVIVEAVCAITRPRRMMGGGEI